jgi:hypothetical protein
MAGLVQERRKLLVSSEASGVMELWEALDAFPSVHGPRLFWPVALPAGAIWKRLESTGPIFSHTRPGMEFSETGADAHVDNKATIRATIQYCQPGREDNALKPRRHKCPLSTHILCIKLHSFIPEGRII